MVVGGTLDVMDGWVVGVDGQDQLKISSMQFSEQFT